MELTMSKTIRIRSHDGGRCRNPECGCRRTRDQAGKQQVKVAEYTAANHLAVEEHGVLTIFQLTDMADLTGITNGVDNRGPNAAVQSQERQAAADAAKHRSARRAYDRETSRIAKMNEKARKLWPTSPNGGGR
jgi:hypothetical protein